MAHRTRDLPNKVTNSKIGGGSSNSEVKGF